MRELILHIGCGKTGSSALQSWLARNQAALAEQGYRFHITNRKALEYRVNAGNAGPLAKQLEDAVDPGFVLEKHYFRNCPTAIVSGERLGSIGPKSLARLNDFVESNQLSTRVICYVRDAYDYLFSKYMQKLKGQNETRDFADFVASEPYFDPVRTVEAWSAYFDVRLIHYRATKSDLAGAFCQAAGIDSSSLQPMSTRRVNRSLSFGEAAAFRSMGRSLMAAGVPIPRAFSRTISDQLIDSHPSVQAAHPFEAAACRLIDEKFRAEIEQFNQRFGKAACAELSIGRDIARSSHQVQPQDPEGRFRVYNAFVETRHQFGSEVVRVIQQGFERKFGRH